MADRVLFGQCPLCNCPHLIDSVIGNCSGHHSYHESLDPVMRWKQCAACAHLFTEGYYTPAACDLIYSKTMAMQQVGFEIEQQRKTSARMIEKVLPYASAGNWLDVGFGNGSLLFTAQEYGFTPIGIDLRVDSVRRLAALGYEAHCQDLAGLVLNTECAVISMADVLEHVPYPKTVLPAAHRLLAATGVLFISMPNTENMVWQALDQQNANPYWGEMEHYHNFSRTRLFALLREFGFEPVRYGISERYRVCMEVIARKV